MINVYRDSRSLRQPKKKLSFPPTIFSLSNENCICKEYMDIGNQFPTSLWTSWITVRWKKTIITELLYVVLKNYCLQTYLSKWSINIRNPRSKTKTNTFNKISGIPLPSGEIACCHNVRKLNAKTNLFSSHPPTSSLTKNWSF